MIDLYFIFFVPIQQGFAEQLPLPIFHRLLRNSLKRDRVQERKCSEDECYRVFDVLRYRDYRPQVLRLIGLTRKNVNPLSASELVFPTDLSIENVRTRGWKVNKGFLQFNPYLMMMSESPFWSGAILRNSTKSHSILLIGVAGSTLNNYWAEKYPQLNITAVDINPLLVRLGKCWYSVNLNDRHRIVVEDGAVFMAEAFVRGERYEAVVLDATYDDFDREVASPIDLFRQTAVIRLIDWILQPSGILIVNVAIGRKTESAMGAMNKIVQDFKKVFKFVEVYDVELNSVMLCRQAPIDSCQLEELPSYLPYN